MTDDRFTRVTSYIQSTGAAPDLSGTKTAPVEDGPTVAALMLLYPPISLCANQKLIAIAAADFRAGAGGSPARASGAAGAILAAAALLRAYPLGMLGYLVAPRDWRACGYFIGASVVGCAAVVACAGFTLAASFARVAAAALLTHTSGVPAGLLQPPANLNLGAFVRLVAGDRGWAFAVELAAAAAAFVAAAALADDRYGCGFALWLVVITMLSPVAWPQFLVCLVPFYVGIAAAWREKGLPPRVLNLAGASYLAALLMGRAVGVSRSRALARERSAPAFFILSAGGGGVRLSRLRLFRRLFRVIERGRLDAAPGADGRAAVGLRASLELGRDL